MTRTTSPFPAPMSFGDAALHDSVARSRFAPKTLLVLPPAAPPARGGSRTGTVVGVVLGVLCVLTGLAVLLLALLGSSAPDLSPAKAQIAATTKAVTGLAPTGLSCPVDVAPTRGAVFTCTGRLDGQPVRYTVTQVDDAGHVTVTGDAVVVVDAVATKLGADMAAKTGLDVGATCDAGGRTVIVGGRGTSFPCAVMNTQDPADRVTFTATIADDHGDVAFAMND